MPRARMESIARHVAGAQEGFGVAGELGSGSMAVDMELLGGLGPE